MAGRAQAAPVGQPRSGASRSSASVAALRSSASTTSAPSTLAAEARVLVGLLRRAGRGSRARPRRGSRAPPSTCQRHVESAPPETRHVDLAAGRDQLVLADEALDALSDLLRHGARHAPIVPGLWSALQRAARRRRPLAAGASTSTDVAVVEELHRERASGLPGSPRADIVNCIFMRRTRLSGVHPDVDRDVAHGAAEALQLTEEPGLPFCLLRDHGRECLLPVDDARSSAPSGRRVRPRFRPA